jgi:hypothetical protein
MTRSSRTLTLHLAALDGLTTLKGRHLQIPEKSLEERQYRTGSSEAESRFQLPSRRHQGAIRMKPPLSRIAGLANACGSRRSCLPEQLLASGKIVTINDSQLFAVRSGLSSGN